MVTDHLLAEQAVRPGATVDRYLIEAKLGEGGAAVVFRARHRQLGTLHALKVLRILAGSLTDRLIREGRIEATLKHRNIVAVTDVIRIGVFPALVMEYVAGLSLDELLFRYRPDPLEIDALARDILEGMHAAHGQGMIHRDLKPGNILLQLTNQGVTAKVGDFGLARILYGDTDPIQRSTRTSVMMGTPAFMAPEQLRSAKNADHRADIFALGAVLYELASGWSAFGGDDLMATYNASSKGKFRPLDEVAPDAPRRWVEAVHAALRPDPADRPQTVEELAELWFAGTEPPDPAWNVAFLRSLANPEAEPGTPSLVGPPTSTATLIPISVDPAKSMFLVFVGTVFAVVLVGSVALAITVASLTVPAAEPEVAVVPPYVELPVVPEPTTEIATPEPAAPSSVLLSAAPKRAALPAVEPEPIPERSLPPDLAVTRFDVTGVERAWLEDPAGHHVRPGAVTPGNYALHVFFDAAKPTQVMTFTLGDGERRLVRCDTLTRICK